MLMPMRNALHELSPLILIGSQKVVGTTWDAASICRDTATLYLPSPSRVNLRGLELLCPLAFDWAQSVGETGRTSGKERRERSGHLCSWLLSCRGHV